jgi:hypothetical protein
MDEVVRGGQVVAFAPPSRSDAVMVARGFSPWIGWEEGARRGATMEGL